MTSKPRKARKLSQREDIPPANTQMSVDDVENDGTVDTSNDDTTPQSIQVQIDNLNSTLLEHSSTLNALRDVPAILSNLTSILGTGMPPESGTFQDDVSSVLSDEDDDLLAKYMDSEETQLPEGVSEQPDSELLDILNVSQPCNEFGENLSEDVSKSFSRMFANRPPKEKIEKWKGDFKPPANCKLLAVPRVNAEIWPQLKIRPRNNDLSYQQHAGFISQAAVAVSKITDVIFAASKQIPKELGQQLLHLCMDTGSILGLASQELSSKRKSDLRPYLNKDFASICTSKNPTTEWLFGDNVLEQLKASKSAANVMKPSFGTPFKSQGQRFQPYKFRPNLNYRRPPFQDRGGHFMSHQQSPQRRFQSRQSPAFPNPHVRRQN